MRTLKQRGFTIIELLIVIVVIGILATLVLNTFRGVQARARDTERKADIGAVHTQLEVFYTDCGSYPDHATTGTMTTCGLPFVLNTTSLPGIDAEALDSPAGTTITVGDPNGSGITDNNYYYNPSGCSSGSCTGYVIGSPLEQAGEGVYTKTSLN